MHTVLPVQLVEQPEEQDVMVQAPVPVQVSEHPPPAQARSTLPIPVAFTEHLPSGQSSRHEPVLAQIMSQPAPAQVLEQAPSPEQMQGVPGLQSPELVPTASSLSPTFTFTPALPGLGADLGEASLLDSGSALASLRSASAWLQPSRRSRSERKCVRLMVSGGGILLGAPPAPKPAPKPGLSPLFESDG